MKQTDPQYKLRLPQDLKDRIEQSSKMSGRSMNAEIVSRLQASYRGPAAADPAMGCSEPAGQYQVKLGVEAVQRIEQRLDRIEQAVTGRPDTDTPAPPAA